MKFLRRFAGAGTAAGPPPSSTFVASSGDGYELQMGRWSRTLAEPFLDFAGARSGEALLDAGCGTGSLTAALLRREPDVRVDGIDFSAAYVDYATRAHGGGNATFRVGDICALPYEDDSFDRVLSLLVLHFVPDTARAVAELRRVARSGATVAAAVWDARGGFVANRIFFDAVATIDEKGNERRARNYTRPMTRPGELQSAWQQAGFLDIRSTTLAIRMDFASFDDYWAPYVGKDGPGAEYVSGLSAEQRERLRDLVRAAYLDGEQDGLRSYAALAWAVAGTAPG